MNKTIAVTIMVCGVVLGQDKPTSKPANPPVAAAKAGTPALAPYQNELNTALLDKINMHNRVLQYEIKDFREELQAYVQKVMSEPGNPAGLTFDFSTLQWHVVPPVAPATTPTAPATPVKK